MSELSVGRFPLSNSPLLNFYFLLLTFPGFLPGLFRFSSQREMTGQGIEDLRIPERPRIINRYSIEAPLVAIARQVAIVAIHQ